MECINPYQGLAIQGLEEVEINNAKAHQGTTKMDIGEDENNNERSQIRKRSRVEIENPSSTIVIQEERAT